jgi:hypothetical protein
MGSNPEKDNKFLRVIKMHSMASFRWKVQLFFPCHKIYGLLKNPTNVKEVLCRQNLAAISYQVPPA